MPPGRKTVAEVRCGRCGRSGGTARLLGMVVVVTDRLTAAGETRTLPVGAVELWASQRRPMQARTGKRVAWGYPLSQVKRASWLPCPGCKARIALDPAELCRAGARTRFVS